MIEIIDFTNYPLSSRNLEYGGRAGEKKGIIYNDEFWFLKFPKSTIGMRKVNGLSYVTSPLSEYLGSQIYKILGYNVHDTILGICNDGKRNKVVCACKDFILDDKNEMLINYTALRNDTNPIIMERNSEEGMSASNINEIIFQLDNNSVLSNIKSAKERFWDVVIIDAIINNNDRNEDNWCVIKNKKTNEYTMAPIYDCGNSFYGKTSNERIAEILKDEEKLRSSALNGITAYEDDDENRISIIEIFKLNNDDLKNSISKVAKNIDRNFDKIVRLFNDIPNYYNDIEIISDDRKKYYLETIKIRYSELLEKNCK